MTDPEHNSFTEYEQRHRDAAAPSIKGARALLDAALTLDAANLEPVGLSWSLGRAGGLVVHMDGPDRVRRAAAVLFGNADVERYRYDPDHPTLLTYRSEVDGAQVQVYGANDRSVLGR